MKLIKAIFGHFNSNQHGRRGTQMQGFVIRSIGTLAVLLMVSGAHGASVIMSPDPLPNLNQGAYKYELELVSADNATNIFTFILTAVQLGTTGQGVNFNFLFDQTISSCAVLDGGGYSSFVCSPVNTLNVGVPETFTGSTSATFNMTLADTPTTLDVTPFFGTVQSATFSVVPIPAALWLFGFGLGMLGWISRRQTA